MYHIGCYKKQPKLTKILPNLPLVVFSKFVVTIS